MKKPKFEHDQIVFWNIDGKIFKGVIDLDYHFFNVEPGHYLVKTKNGSTLLNAKSLFLTEEELLKSLEQ